MPHVTGHKELAPVDFLAEQDRDPRLAPVDFGIGQGRTQQKYVLDNNSIVTMPADSSASFDLRESKEFIKGQEGFDGNTALGNIFNLNATGGLFELGDIGILAGSLSRSTLELLRGFAREKVILGTEKLPTPPEIV